MSTTDDTIRKVCQSAPLAHITQARPQSSVDADYKSKDEDGEAYMREAERATCLPRSQYLLIKSSHYHHLSHRVN